MYNFKKVFEEAIENDFKTRKLIKNDLSKSKVIFTYCGICNENRKHKFFKDRDISLKSLQKHIKCLICKHSISIKNYYKLYGVEIKW